VKILHPNLAWLLQCTATYPCKAEETNLRCIENYRLRYPGIKIGFSNHFPGMTANIGSVFLGAEMLEVHVTLNTSMWGSDHASSCPVDKIPYLMKHIKTATEMRGSGKKEYYESERTKMEQLRA
jgi:N-acetylneuraminate synthase